MRAIARALIDALWAGLLAASLLFLALRALPGDGLTHQLIESGASDDVIQARRASLGLDQPLVTQVAGYLAGLARGDLGVSLLDGRPVRDALYDALPHTLTLAGLALGVGLVGGITVGTAAARTQNAVRPVARLAIAVGLSAPTALIGTLAIVVFALWLDWLPGSGAGTIGHIVLPASVLGWHSAAAIGQVTAAALHDVYSAPYLIAARGRGLSSRRLLVHALRACAPTIVTATMLQAGFLFGGTAITEAIFARPGVGRLLVDAALRQDYPMVQGVALWCAGVAIGAALIGDALSASLDPRLRDVE
ncbi:MAG: ABC transporter permease [Chloroflexota bacterium]|nr:ABC transporter permease [Chloroflexota bacterium]